MMQKELDILLTQLQEDKSLKVWSLIMTFFGDAVLPRGGNVSAKTVQSVLASMSIGAGAVRTAMSRLASDQWIERHKVGRESYYALASHRYEPIEQAGVRIYAPASESGIVKPDISWVISVRQPGSQGIDVPASSIQLSTNCWMYPDSDATDILCHDNLILCGQLQNLPQWVIDKLMPESVRLGYQTLIQRFSTVQCIEALSPLSCLVMRCLLVHEWRRLLLRSPTVPATLHTIDWPENACRQFVAQMYSSLLQGSENWLDEHATCLHGPLPPAADNIRGRFTPDFINQ